MERFIPAADRRGRLRWATALVLPLGLVVILLVTGLSVNGVPRAPAGFSGVRIAAAIPPWNTWTCNPNNPSPAALAIPVKNPGHGAANGSTVSVGYEFRVQNYTSADRGILLFLPTVKAVFPLKPSGELTVTLGAVTTRLSTGHWVSLPAMRGHTTLSHAVSFAASKAYLTTAKAAVMATAPSGSVTLQFRWHWTVQAPGGRLRTGPWTVPNLTASSPYLPSTFYPAPYVGLVSVTGSPAPSGSTYNLTLNGTVANTSFRVVLEYPNNGTEIQSIWENSTLGITTFNASVPLANRAGGQIPAGGYLIHVHDICEAIVHMQSVTVS